MTGIAPASTDSTPWTGFRYQGRNFIRGTVPEGINKGLMFTVARRLGERYEVRKFFASGGCGLLLEGHDLRTETDVLIKTTLRYDGLIEYAKSRDESGLIRVLTSHRKQLQTERRIMVLLKNRGCNGIPNPNDYVFDWNPVLGDPVEAHGGSWSFQNDNMLATEPYLVMERMNGVPLTKMIGNGMKERPALELILQVCHTLSILHQPMQREGREWRLIYQDLKPDNILVGDHHAVSLLDLGGCRLQIGSSVGSKGAYTPGYCAPECQSSDPFTPAVDAYTVGSTLYHMLTGRAPTEFLGANAAIGGPQSVSFRNWDWTTLEASCQRKTVQWIQRCLAEEPSDRPADGATLTREVTQLLSA